MNRKFSIQTLQDNGGTPMDPITIITGGVGLLSSIFPNLFGGGRRRLTNADWLQLFPGSGYWTTALRKKLQSSIHYDSDLKNIEEFTKYFVDENKAQICGGAPCSFTNAFSKFAQILQQERVTGGNYPVGNYPGGIGGGSINYQEILIYGGIAILAITLLSKSKKKK